MVWVDKASPNELQTNNSETPLHSASEDIQEMEASTQNGKQVRNALETAFSTFRDTASLFQHPASQLPPSPTSRSQLNVSVTWDFAVVQWLRLHAYHSGNPESIPG